MLLDEYKELITEKEMKDGNNPEEVLENIEQMFNNLEISKDVGRNERRKIEISSDMEVKEIIEKFDVSRATAFRAKKQGWIFMNYHQRVIEKDENWAEKNKEKLREASIRGAKIAFNRFSLKQKELELYNFDDFISTAYIRLVELSGHENRENDDWLSVVAANAISTFIKTEMFSRKREHSGKVEVEEFGEE